MSEEQKMAIVLNEKLPITSSFYSAGSVTLKRGSDVIVGDGTAWDTAGIEAGDLFRPTEGRYKIAEVLGHDRIRLSAPYSGLDRKTSIYVVELLSRRTGCIRALKEKQP